MTVRATLRNLDRDDQLARLQIVLDCRRLAREHIEFFERDAARAGRTVDFDDGVERDECDCRIRGMCCKTCVARSKNRMHTMKAFECIAAVARMAFVARSGGITEVRTPGAL